MNVSKVTSMEAAIKFLSKYPEARIVAGGTDLLPRINQKLESHDVLCYIDDLPEMKSVDVVSDRSVLIGASVRLSDIAEIKELDGYTALRHAASKVASPQIRNQATIGGNILQENRCIYFNNHIPWSDVNHCFKWGGNQCFQYKKSKECVALFQSDIAPVLIAYNAKAIIFGPEGERELPVEELYLKAGAKNIAHNEVLKVIKLPSLVKGERSSYVRKTIRGSFDFPLLSCAVRLIVGEDGIVKNIKVVFGAAGIKPAVFKIAEETIVGNKISEMIDLADVLKSSVSKVISPFRDNRVNGSVRNEMAKETFSNAIAQVSQTI